MHARLFARVPKTIVEVQTGTSRLGRVSGTPEGPFGTSYRDGAADCRIRAFGRRWGWIGRGSPICIPAMIVSSAGCAVMHPLWGIRILYRYFRKSVLRDT